MERDAPAVVGCPAGGSSGGGFDVHGFVDGLDPSSVVAEVRKTAPEPFIFTEPLMSGKGQEGAGRLGRPGWDLRGSSVSLWR